MFVTVQQQEIKDGVSSDKEKTKLANALRRAANQVSQTRVSLTTNGTAAYTAIWTSDEIPEGKAWVIDFDVAAYNSGTPARYSFSAYFAHAPGFAVSVVGVAANFAPMEIDPSMDARYAVIGNTVVIQVLGILGSVITWDGVVTARQVPQDDS